MHSYVQFIVLFRVRAKALQYFAQCATLENSALVLRVKEALHEPLESPAEGTPTLNRQANSESLKNSAVESYINIMLIV